MNFDKWFNSQSRLVQLILLLIPIVNCLVRLSALIKKQSAKNVIGFILFLIPWGVFLAWCDLIWVLIKNKLILTD